jgi:hypothetical protein
VAVEQKPERRRHLQRCSNGLGVGAHPHPYMFPFSRRRFAEQGSDSAPRHPARLAACALARRGGTIGQPGAVESSMSSAGEFKLAPLTASDNHCSSAFGRRGPQARGLRLCPDGVGRDRRRPRSRPTTPIRPIPDCSRLSPMRDDDVLERVTEICLSLPEPVADDSQMPSRPSSSSLRLSVMSSRGSARWTSTSGWSNSAPPRMSSF